MAHDLDIPHLHEEKFVSAYVHFPYCEAKCHYCDFFSFAESKFDATTRGSVYNAIAAEVRQLKAGGLGTLSTVFLGGGTPSLVPLDDLATALEPLNLASCTEVTIEANPSSITLDKARHWKKLGINRVSMGVQALDDERLKWLGRVHGVTAVHAALRALGEAGFENVSIDYILGVPGQDIGTIEGELKSVVPLYPHIQHVSAYLLTLKSANPKSAELPTDEVQIAHLMETNRVLTAMGFEHYEISNYARPGRQALHNENYWLGGGYVGIGPSAHGFWPRAGIRTKNVAHLEKYRAEVEAGRPPWEWTERLTAEQKALEFLMLRLRRASGFKPEEYTAVTGEDFITPRLPRIERAVNQGLARWDGKGLRLTTRGLFLSDQIMSDFA
jgi:oxygen-independent coproporphyrinogen-3 oxidase